jgi:hypothetical protein
MDHVCGLEPGHRGIQSFDVDLPALGREDPDDDRGDRLAG